MRGGREVWKTHIKNSQLFVTPRGLKLILAPFMQVHALDNSLQQIHYIEKKKDGKTQDISCWKLYKVEGGGVLYVKH